MKEAKAVARVIGLCCLGQLWGLVVASVYPGFCAEQGADEGEPVEVESRQLGGLDVYGRRSVRVGCERGWWGKTKNTGSISRNGG